MAFELKSLAFTSGGDIAVKHTCDGADTSPPLQWSNPPPNTKEFALIVDDPDAPVGTWVHWVLYRIPLTVRELPEGIAAQDAVPGAGTQGMNDFKKVGYGRPVSSARLGAPVLLQAVRPRHRASACAPKDESRRPQGYRGSRAGTNGAGGTL